MHRNMKSTSAPARARMCARRAKRRAGGFTLLELLLVLGLIVAMVGIAWPALRGPFGGARLREAAKQVRVEMSRTRLSAMETDAVYELQYGVDASRFRVRRLLDLNPAESEECAATDYVSDATSGESDASAGWTEFELPEGVVFADPLAPADDGLAHAPVEEASTVGAWSTPIVFYPDGTTSTTEMRLRNERGDEVVITLRGLTGVSHMADRDPATRVVR